MMGALADLGEIIASWPVAFQVVLLFAILGAVYKFIEYKWDKSNGNSHTAIANHLTTAVNDLTEAVDALVQTVRDLQEQTNRVANTSNVILSKMDTMRDMLVRLEGHHGL